MGQDKAQVDFAGRPLFSYGLSTLQSVFRDVALLIGSRRRSYLPEGVPQVLDRRAGLGPMAGLESALELAEGRAVFLLACDLPYVSTELVRFLIGSRGEESDALAIVPRVGGRVQPLCGVYEPDSLQTVRGNLENGRLAMSDLLDSVSVKVIDLEGAGLDLGADLLRNINTPEDLVAC